jgi:hypothetical protein
MKKILGTAKALGLVVVLFSVLFLLAMSDLNPFLLHDGYRQFVNDLCSAHPLACYRISMIGFLTLGAGGAFKETKQTV